MTQAQNDTLEGEKKMYDVAIVGGGPAGLAAAYHLERGGLSAVVLEETDRLGGRALTVDVQGQPINLGAMFVYSGTPSHDLALSLGVPLVPFEPASFGIHVNGETVVASDNAELVSNLPLPQASKDALSAFIARAGREYFDNTRDGQLRPASKGYGETSAQAQLDGLPADVQEILEAAIRGGSVARPSELSATYALRYFASYVVHEKKNRMFARDGMESIPAALADRLVTTEIRKQCSVKSVRQDSAGAWEVVASDVSGTGRDISQGNRANPPLSVRGMSSWLFPRLELQRSRSCRTGRRRRWSRSGLRDPPSLALWRMCAAPKPQALPELPRLSSWATTTGPSW